MLASSHRLPAEFEAHEATWLLWPSRPDNWRSRAFFAQNDILALACLISHFEPVRLGAPPIDIARLSREVPSSVLVVPIDFDDTWVRDTGPTILVSNTEPAVAIDWRFNSWGGLFSDSSADDQVASKIAAFEGIPIIKAPIVLEGGALISDGKGTIVVTEESILADNRNPGLTRDEAEKIFQMFLNVTNVIWIPSGLSHDESGGHIDNVCVFASERVVLVASANERSHPSYDRMRVAKEILSKSKNSLGQEFSLVDVPLPGPAFITADEASGFDSPKGAVIRVAGTPLAPSYINFYLTSGAVFVPTFNTSYDRVALDIIGSAFPERFVIPVYSREFVLGGGGIHCLTKEIATSHLG